MSAPVVEVGAKLPELAVRRPDVHRLDGTGHPRLPGRAPRPGQGAGQGVKDIFVNILTDTGLVQRYITDWAGRSALVKSIGLRLGVPWYAYDTVTFSGEVTAVEDGLVTVKVVGSNSLGDHVIATATRRWERLMLSGKAAIVGIGATDFSKNSGRSELRLAAEAVLDALNDAGLTPGTSTA